MKAFVEHVPWWLALFVVFILGATDLAMQFDARVLITLLAPALWIGFYFLGSDHLEQGS